MENQENHLGFYILNETQRKDGYLGAVLVTDQHGRPLEFRVTHPVKPSVFQRPLYGDALEPFIGIELCGKQLLTHLDHSLDLLIVSEEFLLGVRDFVPCPTVHVQRAGDVIEIEADRVTGRSLFKQQITSSSGRYQPVVIGVGREHKDDVERGRALLEKTFTHVDLLEPFERITRALELLAQENHNFA